MDELRSYSVLDFVRSQKDSALCRFIFCGSTTFTSEQTLKLFSHYAKDNFGANSVTGLLLVYPEHIVHLLESAEDKIFQVCSDFANVQPKWLEDCKCFPIDITIGERFFGKWHARKIIGNCNNETLKTNEDLENVKEIYYKLVNNLYSFCNELRAARAISLVCLTEKLDNLSVENHSHLPSVTVLKWILQSPWGDSLETLVENYWHGICSKEIDDDIWPFPISQCPSRDSIENF